ncbi:hypothetical protein DFQ29_007630 [Apophysomyces sp. BC1021]|nr:hypothetical protein DFQ29_007630 [Apophysomyces sp. BC1021]
MVAPDREHESTCQPTISITQSEEEEAADEPASPTFPSDLDGTENPPTQKSITQTSDGNDISTKIEQDTVSPMPPTPLLKITSDDDGENNNSNDNHNGTNQQLNDPLPLLVTDSSAHVFQRRRGSYQYFQKILRMRRHSISDGLAPSIISSTISMPPTPSWVTDSRNSHKTLHREHSQLTLKGKDLKKKLKRALSFRNK